VITLWGRLSSINVRKVVLAARLAGVEFNRIEAGGEYGVVGSDAFRAMNPNAMVPVLQDGDLVLWESNVIVRYLCTRYADARLVPADLVKRFEAEQWMDWQQTTLNPAGRDAFLQRVRVPAAQRDERRIAASIAATEPLLDLLDIQLSRQAWLAGDRLTMADLPVACEMHRWRGLGLPQKERPALDRWYLGMLALPASAGVLDITLS